MSKIETGGAAFPHDDRAVFMGRSGMTLRDYFAAKALPFVMRFYSEEARSDKFVPDLDFDLAKDAQAIAYEPYRMADAMLKEMERQ